MSYELKMRNVARRSFESQDVDPHAVTVEERIEAQMAIIRAADLDHVDELVNEAKANKLEGLRGALLDMFQRLIDNPKSLTKLESLICDDITEQLAPFEERAIADLDTRGIDGRTEAFNRDDQQRREDLRAEVRAHG